MSHDSDENPAGLPAESEPGLAAHSRFIGLPGILKWGGSGLSTSLSHPQLLSSQSSPAAHPPVCFGKKKMVFSSSNTQIHPETKPKVAFLERRFQ